MPEYKWVDGEIVEASPEEVAAFRAEQAALTPPPEIPATQTPATQTPEPETQPAVKPKAK